MPQPRSFGPSITVLFKGDEIILVELPDGLYAMAIWVYDYGGGVGGVDEVYKLLPEQKATLMAFEDHECYAAKEWLKANCQVVSEV